MLDKPVRQTYAQLAFRNEQGKPRQRTVATLGRIDSHGHEVAALLNGLLLAKSHDPVGSPGMMEDTAGVRAGAGRGWSNF
jgi:hypothetical protein